MMQVMLGMLPMLVKEMKGGKILGRKGRRSGDKGLRGERGEMISTGKGVEKILGGKGEKRPTGKGGKI